MSGRATGRCPSRYHFWFQEAGAYEQAVQSQPRHPDELAAALGSDAPKAQCLALDALEAGTFAKLESKVLDLLGAWAPVAWNARRTLRRLGSGPQAQRQRGPSERAGTGTGMTEPVML
ncbi:hypothetical protein [Hyalangium gracile]|uniref:hypothetical protein n=1 Tax=Hyalangium gracile TaxID=394092 RepID=UPI001CCBF1E2|nr:hypothetical protein [Hyalangium gracile]